MLATQIQLSNPVMVQAYRCSTSLNNHARFRAGALQETDAVKPQMNTDKHG
jgi:hypothetical protein